MYYNTQHWLLMTEELSIQATNVTYMYKKNNDMDSQWY